MKSTNTRSAHERRPLLQTLQAGCLGLALLTAASAAAQDQNPVFVSAWPGHITGAALSVTLTSTNAIVAAGEAGLLIANLTGANPPSRSGALNTPGQAYSVAVRWDDTLAYVADGDAGVQVVAITNATQPMVVGGYDTTGSARAIDLRGSYAFVADGPAGVQILSLTNPVNPVRVGGYATSGEAVAVASMQGPEGWRLYVATRQGGLVILNVTDPARPTLLGTFNPGADINGVVLDGLVAYLTAGDAGLLIVTTTNAAVAAPVLLGTLDTPGYAQGISRFPGASLVQIADGSAGVHIVTITNPAAPVLLGSYNTGGSAKGVAATPTFAYVADGDQGFLMLRVSTPSAPTPVRILPTLQRTLGVAVSGSLVTLANETYGLTTLEVTNPAAPLQLGSVGTTGPAQAVTVGGGLACVAEGGYGVEMASLSNAASPVRLGLYNSPGYAQNVALAGTLACVADEQQGVHFLTLTNPANPVRLGGFDTAGWARSSALVGGFAYVADTFGGLVILSVTNPAAPVWLSTLDTLYAQDIAVAGNLAYIAASGGGLAVVDVSNPASPVLRGNLGSIGSAFSIALSGHYVYLGIGTNEVKVVDVRIPETPVLVGSYKTAGYVYDLAVGGDYLYVATTEWGLTILRLVNDSQAPPTITRQPANQFGTQGGTASFSASAVGTAPLRYQWYRAMAPLADQTSTTLTLTNLTPAEAGSYQLVITNSFGAATSQVATLTVLPANASLGWFVSEDRSTLGNWKGVYGTQGQLIFGAVTNLAVTLSASSYLTFSDNSPNPNALEHPGTVAVTNRFFAAQYSGTEFYVDVTLPTGPTNRLAVYAVEPGGGRIERVDLIEITTGTVLDSRVIGGLTNGTYLVWDVTGPVRVRCTRVGGSNTMLSGVFVGTTPAQAPTLRAQPPASVAVLQGGRLLLGAGLNGSPALYYRWSRNGTPLGDGPGRTGSTTPILDLAQVQFADAGNYVLTTTNSFGMVLSQTVAVQVVGGMRPVLTIANAVVPGQVRLTLTGDPGVTYSIQVSPDLTQWQQLRTADSGSGTVQFTDSTDAAAGRRFYRAVKP